MLSTLDAVIDEQGRAVLAESADLCEGRRALVIVMNEPAINVAEAGLLSEEALADDWNRPEEDEAWSHPEQLASSYYGSADAWHAIERQ